MIDETVAGNDVLGIIFLLLLAVCGHAVTPWGDAQSTCISIVVLIILRSISRSTACC